MNLILQFLPLLMYRLLSMFKLSDNLKLDLLIRLFHLMDCNRQCPVLFDNVGVKE